MRLLSAGSGYRNSPRPPTPSSVRSSFATRSYSGRGIPQGKQEMRLAVVASLSENCYNKNYYVLLRNRAMIFIISCRCIYFKPSTMRDWRNGIRARLRI